MRRYTFYLSVALLAFGIGSFFAVNLYLNSFDEKLTAQSNELKRMEIVEQPPKVITEQTSKEIIHSDKDKALMFFESTLKQWLDGKRIGEDIRHTPKIEFTNSETKIAYADKQEILENSDKQFKPTEIDVDADGVNELAILSNCSPPQFCELWIFKKTKEDISKPVVVDFEVILKTYNEVEKFSLRKSKTKNYFDIETTASYSKSETSLGMVIYKFDGEQYIKEECYDYIYLYKDKNGKLQKLNKPKLISLHCC